MSKDLFAVVLTSGETEAAARITAKYPASYSLAPNIYIVAADALSKDIADATGLVEGRKDLGIRGVVFKLNGSYTGYAASDLWEWLEKANVDHAR